MKIFLSWAKQPSTLLAFALVGAAVAYWFTGSAAVAAGAAAAILGGVNDHTRDLLMRMEAAEDALRPASTNISVSTAAQAATVTSAVVASLKPLLAVAVAFVPFGIALA